MIVKLSVAPQVREETICEKYRLVARPELTVHKAILQRISGADARVVLIITEVFNAIVLIFLAKTSFIFFIIPAIYMYLLHYYPKFCIQRLIDMYKVITSTEY